MDILVTNDDGYTSQGFHALLEELSKENNVVGVAPKSEKSWIGKSISAHGELILEKIESNLYSLTGTPADCVQIGIYDVLDRKPKFVVSGINLGLNAGHGRILSSGTIGAAMEASIDGVRSISTSIHLPKDVKSLDMHDAKNKIFFTNAAKITSRILKIIEEMDFDDFDLISINIPFEANENTPFEITSPDRQPIGKLFFKKGNFHKLEVPPLLFYTAKKGTDLWALNLKIISITPISIELASKNAIQKLEKFMRKRW
jgi:5'-nucleotidase